jgi:hypothetical protein
MEHGRTCGIIAAVCLLSVTGAVAQERDGVFWRDGGKSLSGSLHGGYRIRFVEQSRFLLDETGDESDIGEYLSHRLRLEPEVGFGSKVRLASQVDLFDGHLFGDTSGDAAGLLLEPQDDNHGLDSLLLRKLHLRWESPIGLFQVGQDASHWGLGLLANAGEQDGPFSDSRGGDLVERVLFATAPGAWFSDAPLARRFILALAADAVFRDDNADWMEGDRAYQAVAAAYYKDDDLFAGIYGAWRTQEDRDSHFLSWEPHGTTLEVDVPGDTLEIFATDLFLRYRLGFEQGALELAAEGALVFGSTSRGTNENSPSQLDVLQGGIAALLRVELDAVGIAADLRGGWASGDGNAADGSATGFRFDPGYRVGMILYDDVLSALSAHSVQRLLDNRSIPPSGARSLPTNGAVVSSLFLAPEVEYRPWRPLVLAVGALWAMAPAGLADPYNTNVANGGYPLNPYGVQSDSDQLGYEVDGGLWVIPVETESVELSLAAQGGLFVPGEAFARQDGLDLSPVMKARFLLDLRW